MFGTSGVPVYANQQYGQTGRLTGEAGTVALAELAHPPVKRRIHTKIPGCEVIETSGSLFILIWVPAPFYTGLASING